MSSLGITIAEFDSDSRFSATTGITQFWTEHAPGRLLSVLDREWGYYIPAALELETRRAESLGLTPFLIGGGHSLTYFAVRELTAIHGHINLLHFDAHHDRYRASRLSHYSFVTRLQADLPVSVVTYGSRFENDRAVQIARYPVEGAPWYITFDADYFSPLLVQSVMHPVDKSSETDEVVHALEVCRRQIGRAPIIGADFMEWGPAGAKPEEQSFIAKFVRDYVSLIEEFNATH